MAEIRIEEKKRGAPWLMIFILLAVAAIIGWWLWSNRTSGEPTTDRPVVTDTLGTGPAVTPPPSQ